MSGSVELDLWLHEYEEAALSDALKQRGMTVREYLQQQVNRAYEEMVPSDVRAQVAHRIGEEQAAQLAEQEASRRFAIFHIKEHGEEFRFLTNHNIEFLDAGRLLRNYVRSLQNRPDQGKSFAYWFRERVPLTPAEFNAYVDERLMNSGRVTGAFDIDLDQGTFSAVHIDNGWQTFTAKDVCSAAYFAFRKQGLADNDRWYPGHAHYNFKETLQALKDIHYSGALALETNCLPSEEVSARKSLQYLQMLMEELN